MSRRAVSANGSQGIPEATIARLPVYLRVLYAFAEQDIPTVSSEELAAAAGVNSAKLRKDLSHLGSYGTRGVWTATPGSSAARSPGTACWTWARWRTWSPGTGCRSG
jgi:Putative DNA-binding protein N-terminus